MIFEDEVNLIDPDRSAYLCSEGGHGYMAVTAMAGDGSEHLVLAEIDGIGDLTARYDPACTGVTHEQSGPLPTTWLHRVALRCGRLTKTGRPCRALVGHTGSACARHRPPETSHTHDDWQDAR